MTCRQFLYDFKRKKAACLRKKGEKNHPEAPFDWRVSIFEISWSVEYSTKQKKSQKIDFTADYWLFFNQNARAI